MYVKWNREWVCCLLGKNHNQLYSICCCLLDGVVEQLQTVCAVIDCWDVIGPALEVGFSGGREGALETVGMIGLDECCDSIEAGQRV